MSPEKLATMANQIARFMASKPHDEAVAGLADHISKFWEPRMRSKLFEMIAANHATLDPLVIAAGPAIRPVRTAVD